VLGWFAAAHVAESSAMRTAIVETCTRTLPHERYGNDRW
jgi:hypothetical protein